ncbi:MAG: nucleoside phosphorylase [Bacteroidales bacterium]|nr:nucleoside phosphorylase [Bacteroidales bacterium]
MTIPESELILNPDGTIYHLKVSPENIADHIILVGDPHRVEMIAAFFDSVEFKGQNREIVTCTGLYKGKRITAMSTGMGTDNIDIVLNELDALVNIDLKTRTIKENKKSLKIFRLGTSGGLQPELPLNSVIVSNYGLGFDGLIHYYQNCHSVIEEKLTHTFIKYFNWKEPLPKPYGISASDELIDLFKNEKVFNGITATAPGFYGPQGRQLRLDLAYPDFNNKLKHFAFDNYKILNFEMETSALYALGKMLGHQTLTLCVAIANRDHKGFSKGYKEAMQDLIALVLSKI